MNFYLFYSFCSSGVEGVSIWYYGLVGFFEFGFYWVYDRVFVDSEVVSVILFCEVYYGRIE